MPKESPTTIRLEIGHVLFIDIVGYSKLLINEQSEVLQKLNELVLHTPEVRAAEATNKLIRLPSGDGMALVFRDSPEAPANCALEISAALKEHPDIELRMGIHSGPINEIADVNERANIAGGGINIAQRVMDCGDAGHILVSKRVAGDLAQYREWQARLHDLGDCQVKHGVTLSVVNLYTDELGNPAVPNKFRLAEIAPQPTGMAKWRKYVVIGGATLLLIAITVAFFGLRPKSATYPQTNRATAVASPEKRIAVLPFKPLVPEERDQVLEIGMADTLITKLSNSREIIVTSLTSVRKYGGLDQNPIAAGRELGVDSVLEGNVQRSGDHIRLSARLVKVADGSSLWGSTFDEKFTDVFAVQDAISQKVADALALRLSGEEKRRFARRDTENVAAYQLYLTGRYHFNKLIPPEIRQSIQFYEQAIAVDPAYALAYFGLAEAYRSLAITSDAPPKEVFPQAEAMARRALELNESLAEAHASLVYSYMWFDWKWIDAEREAKRAIDLNPNSAIAHVAYAHLLSLLGRHAEALPEAARGRELDPVSLIINTQEGSFLYHARRTIEAGARLQRTLELDPNFWIAHLFLGKVRMDERNYPAAIAEFEKARDFSGRNSEAVSMLGYVLAISGDRTGAEAILQEALSAQRYVPPHSIAVLYLGLGQMDECFAWLEKAYEDRDVRLSFLRVDPKWDTVRSDPRFVSVLKRIGLD